MRRAPLLLLPAVLIAGCAATAGEGSRGAGAIEIISPAGDDAVGGMVQVVVGVRRPADVARLDVWVDDVLSVASWDGEVEREVSAVLDTGVLDDGLHVLRAVAVSVDGARAEAERTVMVDNGNPALHIAEPLSRVYWEDGEFGFAVTVSDATRVDTLRLSVDGVVIEEIHPVARDRYVVSVDPSAFLEEGATTGTVELAAAAIDESGHGTAVERTVELASRRLWTFDTLGRVWEAPELLWDGGVAVVTSEGVLHVIEEDGTERCHVRADGERGTSSPTYHPAARAVVWGTTHRLRVTSVDDCSHLYVDTLTREFVAKPLVTGMGIVVAVAFDGTLVRMKADGSERAEIALGDLVAGGTAMEVRSGVAEGMGGTAFVAAKVGSTGGALFALGDGEPIVADLTAPVDGDILVTDDSVYFGSADGSFYRYAYDLTRQWVVPASDGAPVLTQPVFDAVGNVVVVGDGEGRVHGRSPDTGEAFWEVDALLERSPTGLGLIGRAGLVMGPTGDIAFGDALGMLHVLTPAGGQVRFQAQISGGGRGDGIVARPAVTSERVYVGAENQTLVALILR